MKAKKVSLTGFISYSHKDQRKCDEFREHLAQLSRERLIQVWHDGLIDQRIAWDENIKSNLRSAQIVILLVSARFLASYYCCEIEVTEALKRHKSGETIVLPVIIGSCDWESADFGKLNAMPPQGKPVAGDRDKRDRSWTQVSKKIRRLIKDYF